MFKIISVLLLVLSAAAFAGQVYTLNPEADAMIRGATTTGDSNFGTSTNLIVYLPEQRQMIARYDLSTISGSVVSAKLNLFQIWTDTITLQPAPRFDIYLERDDSTWTESNVTWNTMVGNDVGRIDTFSWVKAIGQDITVDIDPSAVRAHQGGANMFCLRIVAYRKCWTEFASKEYLGGVDQATLTCSTGVVYIVRPPVQSAAQENRQNMGVSFNPLGQTLPATRAAGLVIINDDKKSSLRFVPR
jgi:hypothetical protein